MFFEQLLRLFCHCGKLNFSKVNATILHALFKKIFVCTGSSFFGTWAFSSCGVEGASPVVEHELRGSGLSNYGTWAL